MSKYIVTRDKTDMWQVPTFLKGLKLPTACRKRIYHILKGFLMDLAIGNKKINTVLRNKPFVASCLELQLLQLLVQSAPEIPLC